MLPPYRPSKKISDEENGFLAAIHNAGADDLPRLAYADWLDERGRTDEAERQRGIVSGMAADRFAVRAIVNGVIGTAPIFYSPAKRKGRIAGGIFTWSTARLHAIPKQFLSNMPTMPPFPDMEPYVRRQTMPPDEDHPNEWTAASVDPAYHESPETILYNERVAVAGEAYRKLRKELRIDDYLERIRDPKTSEAVRTSLTKFGKAVTVRTTKYEDRIYAISVTILDRMPIVGPGPNRIMTCTRS